MTFHVIEARKPGIADEIDLVLAGIEVVDGVVADWLCEDEYVLTARSGQEIIVRQGKDRRADRIDLHVVGNRYCRGAAVGPRPGLRDVEQLSPNEARGRCDRY